MTVVAGIDPSLTSTGVVVFRGDLNPRLERVCPPKGLDGPARLVWLQDHVAAILQVERPVLVAVEGYAMGTGRGAGRTYHIGEWGGVLRVGMWAHHFPYVDVPPAVLKKFATGRGNAKKSEVRVGVWKRWLFEDVSDDVVDAYVLGRIAQAVLGGEASKAQREALAKLGDVRSAA